MHLFDFVLCITKVHYVAQGCETFKCKGKAKVADFIASSASENRLNYLPVVYKFVNFMDLILQRGD